MAAFAQKTDDVSGWDHSLPLGTAPVRFSWDDTTYASGFVWTDLAANQDPVPASDACGYFGNVSGHALSYFTDFATLRATIKTTKAFGATQFGYGLFDDNGATGLTGWSGIYVPIASTTNQQGPYWHPANSYQPWNTTGSTLLNYSPSTGTSAGASCPAGTYDIVLSITKPTSTSTKIDYSMELKFDASGHPVMAGTWKHSGSYTDTTRSTFSYNRVVFLLSDPAGAVLTVKSANVTSYVN